MTASTPKNLETALKLLEEIGLLLVTGSEIPDVCRIVTGQPSKGSWWSNPKAQEIFNINEALDDHPDVTIVKLISGKVTFVHRQLWQHVYAVGTERSEWQLKKLSKPAKLLLEKLDQSGTQSTADLPKSGDIVRELELKLLLHSAQIHTEKGAHAKILETWQEWARRVGFKPKKAQPSNSRTFLETRLAEINQKYNGNGRLPWQAKSK